MPRNALVGVRVTPREKQAIEQRAQETGGSASSVAYDMMCKGNLPSLVAFYFGEDSQVSTSADASQNDATSAVKE